jgi:hypothetical protein
VARTLITDCLLTDPSSLTCPRINPGPSSGGGRSATRAQQGPATGPVEAPPPLRANGEPGGDHEEGEQPPSPLHCLLERLLYWHTTMHQICIVCHSARSHSPSLLEDSVWIGTPWPALGKVSPNLLKNHPSALAESGFVT